MTQELIYSLKSYIDRYYIPPVATPICPRAMSKCAEREEPAPSACMMMAELPDFFDRVDAGFSETLLRLIDLSGKKDSEVYKKAGVDRKLFAKIRSNPAYKPSKSTALAFCIALELDLDGTRDLLERAGYVLSHSSVSDLVAEYFIDNKIYDIFALNEALLMFDQPTIGI